MPFHDGFPSPAERARSTAQPIDTGDGGGPSFLLILMAVGAAMVVLVRRQTAPTSTGPAAHRVSAEQLLATRFARGDIDEDEYLSRLSVLRDGGADA